MSAITHASHDAHDAPPVESGNIETPHEGGIATMTPTQLKRWHKRLALSMTAAAKELRIQERTMYNYCAGSHKIPPPVARLCELIEDGVKRGTIKLPPPYVPPKRGRPPGSKTGDEGSRT